MKRRRNVGQPTLPEVAGPNPAAPTRYVQHLPDLMTAADYEDPPDRRRLRFRIGTSDSGVEILGDSMHPAALEELLSSLEPEAIERMLCG